MGEIARLKILLVQTSFLGDVILSTPVIRGVRKLYPDAEIFTLTTPLASGLLARDPDVAELLVLKKRGKESGISGVLRAAREIRKYNFDIAFSLHRSYRTALLLWQAGIKERIGFADARGAFLYTKRVKRVRDEHAVIRYLSLLFSAQDRSFFSTQLSLFPPPHNELSPEMISLLNDAYVCLFPGSEWFTKRWQGFRSTAEELLRQGKRVCVLGSPSEAEANARAMAGLPVIDLSGKTSLQETMALVAGSSGVVCNDSMALHMASAFGVPRVSVFCATSPTFGFGPWGENGAVIEAEDLPCKPCRRHGSPRCPTGTNRCMTSVASTTVLARLTQLQAASR